MREFQRKSLELKRGQISMALDNLSTFETSLRAVQKVEGPGGNRAEISFKVALPVNQDVVTPKLLPDKYHPAGGAINLRNNVASLRKIAATTKRLTDRQINIKTALGQIDEVDKQAISSAIFRGQLAEVKSWADEGLVEKEQLEAYTLRAESAEEQLIAAKEELFAGVDLPDHYFRTPVRQVQVKINKPADLEVNGVSSSNDQPLVLTLPRSSTPTQLESPKEETEAAAERGQEVSEVLLVDGIVERGDRQQELDEDEIRLLKLLSQADRSTSRADIAQILFGSPDYAKLGIQALLQNLDAKLQYLVGRQVIVSIPGRNGGQRLDRCNVVWEDVDDADSSDKGGTLEGRGEQNEKDPFSSEDAAIVATDFLAHGRFLDEAGIKIDQSLLVRLIRAVPESDLEVLRTMSEEEMNQYLNAIRMDGLSKALEVVTDPSYEEKKIKIAEENPNKATLLGIVETIAQVQIDSEGANLLDKLIETPVEFVQVRDPKDATRVVGISYKDHIPTKAEQDAQQAVIETSPKQNLTGIERMRGAEELRKALEGIIRTIDEANVGISLFPGQIVSLFSHKPLNVNYVVNEQQWVKPDNHTGGSPLFNRVQSVAIAYLARPAYRRNIRPRNIEELEKIIEEVITKYDKAKAEASQGK